MWRGLQRSVGCGTWRSLTPFTWAPIILLRDIQVLIQNTECCASLCTFLKAKSLPQRELLFTPWTLCQQRSEWASQKVWLKLKRETGCSAPLRGCFLESVSGGGGGGGGDAPFILRPSDVINESHRNQPGSWVNHSFTDITSSQFWVLGCLALAQKENQRGQIIKMMVAHERHVQLWRKWPAETFTSLFLMTCAA